MRANKNWEIIPLLIFLLPFILLAPVFVAGKALFWGTPGLQFIPWQATAWETLLNGELPLWNPWLGMGAPLAANYQSALFYLPNWLGLLAYALGGVGALAWLQAPLAALHLAWAAWGMGRLAQRLHLDPLPQAIAGIAFALGGYLVARLHFLSITFTVAWLPWVLLGVYTLTQKPHHRRSWLGLAFSLGMMLLAGHAQLAWYSILLAGLWAGWLSWHSQPSQATWRSKLVELGSAWLRLAGAGLFAAALSAVQLLPTAEYLLQSQRAQAVAFETGLDYSFWPWHFLTLLAPGLFGSPVQGNYWGFANYWEDAIYIGLLPVLLALGVLLRRSSKDASPEHKNLISFFRWLLPVTILLALGDNTPLFPWLYRHVPTFDMFNAPTRWNIWLVVGLALLAGIGAHRWRRPAGRSLYWTRLGTMGAFAVSLGAGLAWLLLKGVKATFLSATALAGLWGVLAGGLSLLAPPAGRDQTSPKSAPRWWSWAVIAVVGVDLLVAGWGLNPGIELDFYRQPSASASDVRRLIGDGRLYLPQDDERQIKYERFLRFDTFHLLEDWRNLRTVLLPNLNLLDNLRSANNFDPMVPGRYASYIELLEVSKGELHEKLLNRMAVSGVEVVDSSAVLGIRFIQQENNLGRVRWTACSEAVEGQENTWKLLVDPDLDPTHTVLIETAQEPTTCEPATRGEAHLLIETANRLLIQVEAPTAGWLVVADTWYPGWEAQVDGEPAEILPADGVFRAVPVPAGAHQVTLVYQPVAFRIGALLSLLAWLTAGALAYRLWRVVRR